MQIIQSIYIDSIDFEKGLLRAMSWEKMPQFQLSCMPQIVNVITNFESENVEKDIIAVEKDVIALSMLNHLDKKYYGSFKF